MPPTAPITPVTSVVAEPMAIAFFQNLFVTLFLAFGAPWFAVVPGIDHAPAITGAAILATVSLLLLSWGYARAEAQILATTEYTGFLWAMMFGWYFYAEPVTLPTIAGALLIIIQPVEPALWGLSSFASLPLPM